MMPKKLFWIGFSSIFVIVGCAIAFFGFSTMQKAKDSESWPSAEGVIVLAEIERHRSDDGTTYSAGVEYEFHVLEELITGNRIKFGKVSTGDPSDARKHLNKYKKGKAVDVFYDQEDPYESVLEPGVHGSTWFMPIFGIAFALFGSIFVLIGIFKA